MESDDEGAFGFNVQAMSSPSNADSSGALPRLNGEAAEAIVSPTTEQEAAAIVRDASSEASALVPWGGGTHIEVGNTLRAERWMALSTGGMRGIVEYSAPDLVITVRAGTALADVSAVLAEQNQFLAIDHPAPRSATIGGIVAANAQGLYRSAYGLPRDQLLGLRVVAGTGEIIKGGGKVVKNVAGYDLCKLFAGSWGTLGLITECTFRTSPLPARRENLAFRAADLHQALTAAVGLYEMRSDPLFALVCSNPAAEIHIGLAGGTEAVQWKRGRIVDTLRASGMEEIPACEEPLNHAEATLQAHGTVRGRFTLRPSCLPDLAIKLAQRGACVAAQALPGQLDFSLEASTLSELESVASAAPPGASLVWLALPSELKQKIDVWGPVRADFPLMKGIKAALDPHGVFSPGRFVGRL